MGGPKLSIEQRHLDQGHREGTGRTRAGETGQTGPRRQLAFTVGDLEHEGHHHFAYFVEHFVNGGVAIKREGLRGNFTEAPDRFMFDAQEEPRGIAMVLPGRPRRAEQRGVTSPERDLHVIHLRDDHARSPVPTGRRERSARAMLPWSPQPGWRNRQTRRPQKSLLERVCGFNSHSGHEVTFSECLIVPTFPFVTIW